MIKTLNFVLFVTFVVKKIFVNEAQRLI